MGTARSAIAFSISSELQPALSMPVGQFGAERGQLLRQPPQKPVGCSAVFLLPSLSIAISYFTVLFVTACQFTIIILSQRYFGNSFPKKRRAKKQTQNVL